MFFLTSENSKTFRVEVVRSQWSRANMPPGLRFGSPLPPNRPMSGLRDPEEVEFEVHISRVGFVDQNLHRDLALHGFEFKSMIVVAEFQSGHSFLMKDILSIRFWLLSSVL